MKNTTYNKGFFQNNSLKTVRLNLCAVQVYEDI